MHISSNDERQMKLMKIPSDDETQFRVRLYHLANRNFLKVENSGLILEVIQTRSKNQRNPTFGEGSIE